MPRMQQASNESCNNFDPKAMPQRGFLMKHRQRPTRRAWSKDDVRDLRAFAKAKLSAPQIARKLRRTAGAVNQKGMVLGVRFRSIRSGRARY